MRSSMLIFTGSRVTVWNLPSVGLREHENTTAAPPLTPALVRPARRPGRLRPRFHQLVRVHVVDVGIVHPRGTRRCRDVVGTASWGRRSRRPPQPRCPPRHAVGRRPEPICGCRTARIWIRPPRRPCAARSPGAASRSGATAGAGDRYLIPASGVVGVCSYGVEGSTRQTRPWPQREHQHDGHRSGWSASYGACPRCGSSPACRSVVTWIDRDRPSERSGSCRSSS